MIDVEKIVGTSYNHTDPCCQKCLHNYPLWVFYKKKNICGYCQDFCEKHKSEKGRYFTTSVKGVTFRYF